MRAPANKAESGVSAAAVTDGLATDTIFLGGKSEGNKGRGCQKFSCRAVERVETAVTDPDPDILDTKEVVGGGTWSTTIFPRSEQEKVSEQQAIACWRQTESGSGGKSFLVGLAQYNQRERLDTRRRWVGLLPGA